MKPPKLTLDVSNSEDNKVYIDIDGIGSVCIQSTPEGIICDLFSHDNDMECVATMGATFVEILYE